MNDFNDLEVPVYLQAYFDDIKNLADLANTFGLSLDTYLMYHILLKLNGDVFITH